MNHRSRQIILIGCVIATCCFGLDRNVNSRTAEHVTEVLAGSCAENALRGYESSGAYLRNHEQLLEAATFYVRAVVRRYTNPAIVFDVDETTLSNFDFLQQNGFCLDIAALGDYWDENTLPALQPSLALYNVARDNGVTVFFITGRREADRAVTEANLAAAGYDDYESLYLKPDEFNGTTVEYKSSSREEITNMGFQIMLNVGDQFSDLDGGFADRTLLVPNPFYFVP